MKNITTVGLFLLACTFFLTSCSKESIDEQVTSYDQVATRATDYNYDLIEVQILEEINIYRKANGLADLKPLKELSIEAEDHNFYMIDEGVVSHDNFSFRASYIMNATGAREVSENVAYGYRTADAVVKAWLKSKEHKQNIEDSHTHFGISVRQDAEGKNYFTNIFIKK
ncbi:CAP domain-containing protein [Gramella sp. AN32]|uniref:CAP domain-containing protein n=1 Tax=Christiangramia antarctica TaxID=2058158 RepID=A0ABW5X5K3_9FLAO|nr:CAP domain-containing protein [Gramella sp. AN32]MCM4158034.1 CAP domain-containing protein [Gramella sp. AN32]